MKLKELRKNHNLTQQDLANALNINRMKYNHYELGNAEPNIEILIKLADFYKITIDDLVGHEVPYMLNRVQFSEKQLELIERIKTLNERQCERVDDFITGIIGAQDARELTIKRLSDN